MTAALPSSLSDPGPYASVDFHYYPGQPEGHAGFTDHHAMMQSITDALIDRAADWQFNTMGFAKGFVAAVMARAGDLQNVRAVFRVADATEGDAEVIGWMTLMQKEGTDNAYPSTSNLRSVVEKIASDISATGPNRMKYWSPAPEGQTEKLAETEMYPGTLVELRVLMENAEQRGARLAASAQIIPLDFSNAK